MNNALSMEDARNIRRGRTDLVDPAVYTAYLERQKVEEAKKNDREAIYSDPQFQKFAEKAEGKPFSEINPLRRRRIMKNWLNG